MYSFRYRFYPDAESKENYYDTVLSSFLAALHKNGQIVGEWDIADLGGCLELACITPDRDSLDSRYYNAYVSNSLGPLLSHSDRSPQYTLAGTAVGLGAMCECESPSSYVLFTTFLQVEPPVLCGDCGGHVPLYRLPHCGDELDYASVLGWESTYKACDTLYILSGVGESFGLEEMSNPESELTREGLGICGEMSSKTGRPFYYFLSTYDTDMAQHPLVMDWTAVEPIAGLFDLKCDACKLVSISQD